MGSLAIRSGCFSRACVFLHLGCSCHRLSCTIHATLTVSRMVVSWWVGRVVMFRYIEFNLFGGIVKFDLAMMSFMMCALTTAVYVREIPPDRGVCVCECSFIVFVVLRGTL